MQKEKKVTFTKGWKFSPNGYSVISYVKGQEATLGERGYELAKEAGVIADNKKASKTASKASEHEQQPKKAPERQDTLPVDGDTPGDVGEGNGLLTEN